MKYNTYYSLLIKNKINNKWAVEFGDEDKECVQYELEDSWLNEGVKKKDTKIICTDMNQKIIDTYVDNLNKGVK